MTLKTIMRLTGKQQRDIDICKWFYPCNPTDGEVKDYLALSEHGEGKQKGKWSNNPLIIAKTRRGLTLRLWEMGILEGVTPYFTLLGGYEGHKNRSWYNPIRWILGRDKFWHIPIPRYIVDFMKKELFKGIDAEQIEKLYQEILVK